MITVVLRDNCIPAGGSVETVAGRAVRSTPGRLVGRVRWDAARRCSVYLGTDLPAEVAGWLPADELGLGKTLSAIAGIHALPAERRDVLVVCPLSVTPAWRDHHGPPRPVHHRHRRGRVLLRPEESLAARHQRPRETLGSMTPSEKFAEAVAPTSDRKGHHQFLVGLDERRPFAVERPDDPPRIVIDIFRVEN
jgi:hypothetical protein